MEFYSVVRGKKVRTYYNVQSIYYNMDFDLRSENRRKRETRIEKAFFKRCFCVSFSMYKNLI